MGYTTDFWGSVSIDKPVDEDTFNLVTGICRTRRMKRDPQKLAKRLKMTKKEVLEKYGAECQFYFEEKDFENAGQAQRPEIVEFNRPPCDQPSLWCQWQLMEDRQTIEWDGGEKFYNYVEWMEYLVDKILEPQGYIVNGEINWQGEDSNDKGKLVVVNNEVEVRDALIFYVPQSEHRRISLMVENYLDNPLKEVIDHKLDDV